MRVKIEDKTLFMNAVKSILPKLNLCSINGLTIDSRKVEPGDIFLPLRGNKVDGHDFISEAELLGASITIIEKDINCSMPTYRVNSNKKLLYKLANEYRQQLTYPLLGITGSNGKTTTKDLLVHILSSEMNIAHTKGNYNSTTGANLSIFQFDSNADIVIVEMGANKPGEIELLCKTIEPNMGLITNINFAHIANFNSQVQIAETKSAIFKYLPNDGTAFINLDDPFISEMETNCKRIEYSLNLSSDYYGEWIEDTQSYKINQFPIELSYYSQSMIINVLAAFSIALELGCRPSAVISRLKSFKVRQGRGKIIELNTHTIIDDSYNANLTSMQFGILSLSKMSNNRRKIVVLGDMLELGSKAVEHHKFLGRFLNKCDIDAIFAYGELIELSIQEIHKKEKLYYKYFSDKDLLIHELNNYLGANDIIYIKGSRSMHMEDIITGLSS